MKRSWRWAIVTSQIHAEEHKEVIDICRYAGFKSMEVLENFIRGIPPAHLEEVRKQYEESGVEFSAFHLPFSKEDDLAAFYETERKYAESRMLDCFQKAALLGSEVCVLHPSTTVFDVDDEGIDRYLYFLGKSLEALLPRAQEFGLTIAVENMLPGAHGYRLGSRPEHFKLFAEKFDHPNLGFCLDTGHAHISHGESGPVQFFDVMKDRLIAFHLQDNAGDRDSHLAPGHGLIDWQALFERMSAINFSRPVSIEAPPFHYGPKYSLDAWKGMVEDMERLF